MHGGSQATKTRGVGASWVDVAFALIVVLSLIIAALTLFDSNIRGDLARAYARQFRLASEEKCPRSFGRAFWFACASEVRRTQPQAASVPLIPAAEKFQVMQ